ncbi:hypothetical protein [Helicobacter sp. MIT 05-5294]|uniref:hypothetical protein n=1 Tax=Helicobacter sp. MIT 05-5294 TaxID=1548150 RepID=UPI00051FE858|nr:hypothetical protein [Helicobacter sp. MIT 05-5294]TLD88639.1 hypothetical protein LS69_001770 [Helicobacter sp. MIT 05-5294]
MIKELFKRHQKNPSPLNLTILQSYNLTILQSKLNLEPRKDSKFHSTRLLWLHCAKTKSNKYEARNPYA